MGSILAARRAGIAGCEALDVERWNMLHPMDKPRVAYVTETLAKQKGPLVAATDYIRSFPEQVRPFISGHHFVTLGTDGYGRSDRRSQLRKFFEVNRHYVVVAALKARFPAIVGPHKEDICYATTNRQEAVGRLAEREVQMQGLTAAETRRLGADGLPTVRPAADRRRSRVCYASRALVHDPRLS